MMAGKKETAANFKHEEIVRAIDFLGRMKNRLQLLENRINGCADGEGSGEVKVEPSLRSVLDGAATEINDHCSILDDTITRIEESLFG